MSVAMTAIFAIVALLGVALSAVLAGLEIGLYTVNRVRLTVRADRGDSRAARIRAIVR